MILNSIPKERVLTYLLCLGAVPIIAVLIYMYLQNQEITQIDEAIIQMEHAVVLREKKQAVNRATRDYYREADHFYIDKYLETLTFLEPEIESLQSALNNTVVAEEESHKKRLEFLMGSGNTLSFSEGVVQSGTSAHETTESLVHPVEINAQDLQKILARIEGVQLGPYLPGPNPPQLIILDFKLDRKSISDKNEVFLLNLKLLKREYTPSR
jgi:hypothetical protein